jgi:hypothetical protein
MRVGAYGRRGVWAISDSPLTHLCPHVHTISLEEATPPLRLLGRSRMQVERFAYALHLAED